MQRFSIRGSAVGLAVLAAAEQLRLSADAHSVADPLDAHLLECGLVHFHEDLAGDVVLLEEVGVLGAVDPPQPVADLLLVPVSGCRQYGPCGDEQTPYLTESKFSLLSEKSDSVGLANEVPWLLECGGCWARWAR